jgi:hypothetical protein
MTAHPAEQAGGYRACHDLACALNLGAAGLTCVQAGVELLIDTDIWLHRAEFTRQFVTVDTSVASARAFVDWEAAIAALNAGRLTCSGGERRILAIAASMAGGVPVDLQDALTGLDASNLGLVAEAVRHSAGSRTVVWGEEA